MFWSLADGASILFAMGPFFQPQQLQLLKFPKTENKWFRLFGL
jgi:hypothetical protein